MRPLCTHRFQQNQISPQPLLLYPLSTKARNLDLPLAPSLLRCPQSPLCQLLTRWLPQPNPQRHTLCPPSLHRLPIPRRGVTDRSTLSFLASTTSASHPSIIGVQSNFGGQLGPPKVVPGYEKNTVSSRRASSLGVQTALEPSKNWSHRGNTGRLDDPLFDWPKSQIIQIDLRPAQVAANESPMAVRPAGDEQVILFRPG